MAPLGFFLHFLVTVVILPFVTDGFVELLAEIIKHYHA